MESNTTIAVAMSGGVDSSAVAALLRAEGHALLPGRGKKPPRVADLERRMAM